MKTLVSLFAAISMMAPLAANSETPPTRDVTVSVNDVYVPGGFSSETDAFVVVSGMFPNSCYHWDHGEVTNVTPMVQEVRSIAKVAQTMCLMVMVPFNREVRLGRLSSGEHTLRFVNGDGTFFERKLVIE